MKIHLNRLFVIVLLILALGIIVMPALAQDDEPPVVEELTPIPQDETIVPVETEVVTIPVVIADVPPETNPWLRFLQMLGDGINSFVGGASFMALLLLLTGKLSTDKNVIGLLESATQGLRDSYPPETRQWIKDLGTAVRNVGIAVEEVFDDIPIADKSDPADSLG